MRLQTLRSGFDSYTPCHKGDGMDSVQFQAVLQYLEAIRREQKKTSDMIVGVGTILIVIGVFTLIW